MNGVCDKVLQAILLAKRLMWIGLGAVSGGLPIQYAPDLLIMPSISSYLGMPDAIRSDLIGARKVERAPDI